MNLSRLKRLMKSACSPLAWFNLLSQHGLFNKMSDKLYLKMLFRLRMGYKLDLDNPRTFNEKLQWLKLYDRKPEYTKMVDKYEAKNYVASIIGEEHIIPTLGVWDDPDEIDFDSLPNQFVLKCTHNSGYGMCICKEKATLDVVKVKSELKKGLKQNYFYPGREWPYKNVKPRVIAEKYMEDDTGELADYKVYCFNGTPGFVDVCKNRFTEAGMTEDYFSTEWEHLEVRSEAHGQSEETIEKPTTLVEMLSFSEKLAKDIPFVMTDYYSIGNDLYFGELTFYSASGFEDFEPKSWDETFGNWIELPHTHTHTHTHTAREWLWISSNFAVWVHGKYDEVSELRDYKFYCFNGRVKCFKIDYDRFTEHRANYYDRSGKLLMFGLKAYLPDYNRNITIPNNLNELICLAETLASGKTFLRVDFYNVSGKIFWGELTFYPGAGFEEFTSPEWDEILGGWLELPKAE